MKKYKKNNQSGFTLIELLVVIALLIIILSTSLFSYDKFGKDIELENAVYSMALAIREAQTYGVNKKARDNTAGPKEFGEDYGYGIHITNITTGSTVNWKTFVLFEDKKGNDGSDPNEVFDEGSGCVPDEECYSQIFLTKGNYISNIRVKDSGEWTPGPQKINIFFKRPNPDAKITNHAVVTGGIETVYERVGIEIKDQSGDFTRCVEVGVAGDITIKKNCD